MIKARCVGIALQTHLAMTKTKSPSADSAKPLVKALHQNGTVKETVKQSADELVVINAVLNHGIPDHAQTGDVAQALENTEIIEEKIQTSAQDLASVNKLLVTRFNKTFT